MRTARWLGLVFWVVSCSLANDIDSLFVRVKEYFSSAVPEDSVRAVLFAQRPDGTWEGPEYRKKGRMPIEHLQNVRLLSEGYEQFCSVGRRDYCGKLERGILKALDFWFMHKADFVSDNWWMNEVGVQHELSPISFLMWEKMPPLMRRAVIDCYPREPSGNGTNRSWISENVLVRGILEREAGLIRLGLKNLEGTMAVTKNEGPQADHAFFMHGFQLYNGCYGKSALYLASRWAAVTRGTKFAFGEETIRSMAALALEGNRWMMWKGMADAMTLGREISLKGGNKYTSDYAEIVESLALVDSSHRGEYGAWLNDIAGDESLRGCRYFWRGEMLVCKSKSFYASVKMSSRNTVGTEFLNRQNKKGLWLGTGVSSVYRWPDDYGDVYPLWDWSMLPGTTSYGESELKEKRVTSRSDFAGGIGFGQFGVAAMELERPALHGKKSWFFFEDKMVSLGADIGSSHGTEVRTTLDQRPVRSEVWTENGKLEGDGLWNARGVWHGGIGYRVLDGQTMNVAVETRVGNWSAIGTQKAEERGKVLSLWLNHGKRPSKAGYAYMVDAGADSVSFLHTVGASVSVVRNDAVTQVVYDPETRALMGAFFMRGKIEWKGVSVEADGPALFALVRQGENCTMKIAALKKTADSVTFVARYADESGRDNSRHISVKFANDGFSEPGRTEVITCPSEM